MKINSAFGINKINVVEFNAKTYDEVKKTITMLGDIYGTADKAKAENLCFR